MKPRSPVQRRGLVSPVKTESKPGETKNDPWRTRIDALFRSECERARDILQTAGISPKEALSFVKSVSGSGAIVDIDRNAPIELHDATHPCFFAIRLLALAQLVGEAEPSALQVGRRWGQLALGMNLPQVSKAVRDGHLAKHRGDGGSAPNDLTRTIKVILERNPEISRQKLLEFLESDEATDSFHSTSRRDIFISGVEIDDTNRIVTYEDQAHETHKITFASIDRKLRDIRKKLKR